FLERIELLKTTCYYGWVIYSISNPESVVDYSYRIVIFNDETGARASKIVLIHDIEEAVIRDITLSDGISLEEKYTHEVIAIKFLIYTIHPINLKFADRILEL
ncbi:hypothetical protein CC78DRAFT_466426, partial [Lojkania enalia]